MSKLYRGNFDELKSLVVELGVSGTWRELDNGHKQYTTDSGAVLNWWDTKKKTISFQGDKDAAAKFEEVFFAIDQEGVDLTIRPTRAVEGPNKKVFVVYGHDEDARTQLDAMLRRWGLEPLILDQLPSKGQTIIEKLEEYTADVGFGVVLSTPDDEGHRRDHQDEKTYRARQNVVLELGMLLTKLGREKVAILLKDQERMERPSDIQGLIYIPFKDNLQRDAGAFLAKEMAAQGYGIDIKNL